MTFHSSKSLFTVTLFWAMAILLPLPFIFGYEPSMPLEAILIVGTLSFGMPAMLIWILFDTKYVIKDELLYYRSGPFRGKIAISGIRRIENDQGIVKTTFYKPALGIKGIVIHYNKFDDIFISPKEKGKFIAALLEINPEISVKN